MRININYLCSEVAFDLTFGFDSSEECDKIDDFHEGVEFSVKRNKGEWIPLMFFSSRFNTTRPFIDFPSFEQTSDTNSKGGTFALRGYMVPYVIQTEDRRNYSVDICHNNIFQDKLQFRWLQTSYQMGNLTSDIVILDNVVVRAWNCSYSVTLLEDDFDNRSSLE